MAQRTDDEQVKAGELEREIQRAGSGRESDEAATSRTHARALMPKRRRRWPLAVIAIALAVLGALVWKHYAGWVSTDDAEIDGYVYPISARIAGHVINVPVENTQYVDRGTVLVKLDKTDYTVALDHAKAQLADAQAAAQAAQVGVPITSVNTLTQVHSAQADVESAQAGIGAAQKQYQAAQATLEEAEANNVKSQDDLKRYAQLVNKQEISRQQYDQAVAAARASTASVAGAEATAAAAEQQVAQARSRLVQADAGLRAAGTRPQQLRVTRARADAAAAQVQAAEAAIQQAELNLQYTTIVAPVSGIVGQRTVVAGQNIAVGQALMAIVPTENIWVTADFKETQLRQMRAGQPAVIHVDAYARDYNGHVDGIAGATGVKFSLLPPENATGNYVKVVQRVPVRILFEKGQDPQHVLRVGMSVGFKVKVQ